MTKVCKMCEKSFPLDGFHKNKSCKDGFANQCKICRSTLRKQHYQNNKDRVYEVCADWRIRNPEKLRSYERKQAAKIKSCPERLTKHRDRVNKNKRDYRQRDYVKVSRSIQSEKRRAMLMDCSHPLHNPEIEKQMRVRAKALEKEHGEPYEIDHIWPISKGGPHYHLNLQAIPARVNSEKNDRLDYFHPESLHWTDLPESVLEFVGYAAVKNAEKQINVTNWK